ITMEYVEGPDLRDVLRQLARERMFMPVRVVIAILLELCDALDYAHQQALDETGTPLGIVHRDISPSNLIITQGGHLKVIDFGIAKAAPRELATASGRVKGKFGYMAPEALEGCELDGRTDIFSAGVVAYELLSTRRLFGSSHSYDTIAKMHRGDIGPPSEHNPRCPRELDDAVLRALERDPDERFQSAEELRAALYAVAARYGLEATSDQTAEYLDFLLGQPVEVVLDGSNTAGPTDQTQKVWLPELAEGDDLDEDSVVVLEEFTLVESVSGIVTPEPIAVAELPPPRPLRDAIPHAIELPDAIELPAPGALREPTGRFELPPVVGTGRAQTPLEWAITEDSSGP
ncbi:MAG TPA: serine/threonine-protein kinase, partial [Kofleriaceae bacterium]|nr:serine/threonine-protein kinase [Kofleriaceae bacterium]